MPDIEMRDRVRVFSLEQLDAQVRAVLAAWGMSERDAESTASVLAWADRSGIDSHGISLLHYYSELVRAGRVVPAAEPIVVRRGPAMAALDAARNLGAPASVMAIDMACEMARTMGVGAVTVRNSAHYGAAGFYAQRAADQGLIGLSTSSVTPPFVVPPRGVEPMFGTNPIAVSAPSASESPFLFDIATSAVALGKVVHLGRLGRQVPEGWAIDAAGRPLTDPDAIWADPRMLPIGGTEATGGHKGYGLGAVVEMLSTILSGASFPPLREKRRPGYSGNDLGHFFLAIDPAHFRGDDGFADDLDAMNEALRASTPIDPERPVLVPGDIEAVTRLRRDREGVPLPEMFLDQLRVLTAAAGAPFLLEHGE